MKRLILLLVLSMVSCGSRKVELRKLEQKTERAQLSQSVNAESILQVSIRKDTVVAIRQQEKLAESSSLKQSQKTEKRKEYFENGTLKSETETSQTESEQLAAKTREAEHWKQEAARLEKTGQEMYRESMDLISEYEKELQQTKQKLSEKSAYPWWQLLIGGYLIGKLLEILLRNLWFKIVK